MPAAGSTQDFIMFRDALTEVERLVDVQGNIPIMGHILTTIREGIICKLKLLIELDMDTSESNAIEELGRLAALVQKTALQARSFLHRGQLPYLAGGVKPEDEQMLYKMINSKVDFIKKGSFNRLVCGGDIEPMAALERLTEVQKIFISEDLNEILESKFKEIVYTPRPKASSRYDHHAVTVILTHSSLSPNPTLFPQPTLW